MVGASLPPGFRFHPTDEELVGYYLQRKVNGLEIELEVIPVIDLYKFDPWELPEKSFLPKRDMEWFFFCPRDRKYPNGSRTNRATKAGYWKATGKDRKILCQSDVTGYRKTLVFYRGRAPLGDRTDWVMHEYRLCDDASQGSSNSQAAFALCRVIKKNDQGHKMSDSHGAHKANKAGSSNGDSTSAAMSNEPLGISRDVSSQATYPYNESTYSSPIFSPYRDTAVAEPEHVSLESNPSNFWVSSDLILDSSKDYTHAYSMAPGHQHENMDFSPRSSYSNFAGEIEPVDDLSRIGYMSPYSEHSNYMGYYGNEDTSYEGFDTWDQALTRQASGDGNLGDYGNLWS